MSPCREQLSEESDVFFPLSPAASDDLEHGRGAGAVSMSCSLAAQSSMYVALPASMCRATIYSRYAPKALEVGLRAKLFVHRCRVVAAIQLCFCVDGPVSMIAGRRP